MEASAPGVLLLAHRRGGPRAALRDVLLVAAVALLAHVHALTAAGFTFDDHAIVVNNPRLEVHGPADLRALVAERYWGDTNPHERLWRPLVFLSLAADRALLGPGPRGFHATNVLLHAAVSGLVLLLLSALLPSRRAAALGALLFAVHPVHAEATTGIVGRAEVLALLGVLGGILLHLRGRTRGSTGAHLGAAVCFFLGACAKEVALAGPLLALAVEAVRRDDPAPSRLPRALPLGLYAAAVAVYLACRATVLGGLVSSPEAHALRGLPLTSRLLVAASVVRDAVVALGVPRPTAAVYPVGAPPSWTDPLDVGTALGAAALLGLGAWALLRRAGWARAAGAGVVGIFLALGPVSNLVPIGVVFADRLLYTASAFACLALAALATPALRAAPAVWPLLGLLLLPFAGMHVHNQRTWSDDRTLWQRTAARFPDSPWTRLALGETLLGSDGPAAALPHLEAAVAGFPPDHLRGPRARALLGTALARLGREPEALQLLHQARAAQPGSTDAALGLAELHLRRARAAADPAARDHELALAERVAREGTRFAPHSYELWLLLGTVLGDLPGRQREADEAFTRAIERRPDPWQARFNRARLRLHGMRRLEDALEDLRVVTAILAPAWERTPRGQELEEVLPEAMLSRAVVALQLDHTPEARQCLEWLRRHAPAYRPEAVRSLTERAAPGA